jgi:hypothetical protein
MPSGPGCRIEYFMCWECVVPEKVQLFQVNSLTAEILLFGGLTQEQVAALKADLHKFVMEKYILGNPRVVITMAIFETTTPVHTVK